MTKLLPSMIKLLNSKPIAKTDRRLAGEREILRNRIIMGVPAFALCIIMSVSPHIIGAFLIYLACNGLLILGRYTNMNPRHRWLAAIMLDAVMAAVVQINDPKTMAFAYPIMLWAILGNGFRYGNRWLCAATIAKFASFAIVVLSTAFWRSMPELSIGLLAGLVALPLYCSKLIAKLSQTTNEAEAANRAKTYFLAGISHELRTPLNAIIGYSSQLSEENLSPRVSAMIESSQSAAEHLLYLIDQLLYVSRTESMQAPIKPVTFTLPDLLAQTRVILQPQANEKQVTLNCHARAGSDQLLTGAADMMRNMLLNLASNAIKFTDQGQVVLEGGIEDGPGGPQLWFAVEDNGVGIALHAQQRIFEPFTQADDSVLDRFGGTGLGLAICRNLAAQLGGTMEVQSEVGKGSRFTYRGPITLASEAEPETEDAVLSILCLGPQDIGLVSDDARVDWRKCTNVDELGHALDQVRLDGYDIALIDDSLVKTIDPDHAIWTRFAEAQTAPVLMGSESPVDLKDIQLRAAFATVIPAQPDFAALRSAVRIGCSFRIVERAVAPEETLQEPPAAVKRRSILVADDNRTNREVLKTILEAAGHDVHFAVDGEDTLNALERLQLDMLFLDVNMPKLSGIEVCAMWRQIEGPRNRLPILGLTADATEETEKRCLDAGMDARFTKPIRRVQLLEAIERYCFDAKPGAAAPDRLDDPLEKLVPISGRPVSETSVLDPAQIDSLLEMGGEEFLAALSDSYSEDVTGLLVDIERSAREGDLEAFRFAAHAIKSSAANIGAKQLSALCGKLEKITAPDFAAEAVIYADKVGSEAAKVQKELAGMTAGMIRAA